MSIYEVKVILISFIWAVGVTRILESFGALWVARTRVRFAASQLLWMVAILVDILGNWLAAASAAASQVPPGVFLGILLYSLGLFFAATVVSPKVPEEGFMDLADYETQEGAAYKITIIVLMLLGILMEGSQYRTESIWKVLAMTWSAIATIIAFAVGLVGNKHIRTAAAAAAVLLAIYGLNLFLPGLARP